MHGEFRPGDRLFISPPANMFLPDWQARHHILIAGGIGITPFLSYGYELEQRQASFEVHYVYRNAETGAFREALTERFGNRLYCYSGERPDFYTLLGHQPLGTHVYVCGPEAMIQDVKATASALGWSPQRVHYEAFTAPQPGKPFVARLSRSQQDVAVAGIRLCLTLWKPMALRYPICVVAVYAANVKPRWWTVTSSIGMRFSMIKRKPASAASCLACHVQRATTWCWIYKSRGKTPCNLHREIPRPSEASLPTAIVPRP